MEGLVNNDSVFFHTRIEQTAKMGGGQATVSKNKLSDGHGALIFITGFNGDNTFAQGLYIISLRSGMPITEDFKLEKLYYYSPWPEPTIGMDSSRSITIQLNITAWQGVLIFN